MITKKITYSISVDGQDFDLSENDIRALKREFLNLNDWRDIARAGLKIDAIRRFREITKCGLKEGKDSVEAFLLDEQSEDVVAYRYLAKFIHPLNQTIRSEDMARDEEDVSF